MSKRLKTKPKTFKSADGSTRCSACHLHPDTCTCEPENAVRQILKAALADDPRWREIPRA
jgi:hypothetical protein